MKRMLTVMVGVLTTVAFISLPVLATEAADVVGELELRGYFIEAGSDVDFGDLERLAAEWADVYFVVLARDPSGGADLVASDALSALGLEGTVIVVSPGEIGVRSTIYSDDEIDRALDDAFELFDASYYDGFATFAGALEPSSSGGGFIFLLIIVAIAGLIWWAIRRSNRNREGTFQTRIDEVKAEIQGQLSEAANDILELEDDILLSDNQDAKELYYSGSAGYAQFQEQLAGATSLAQLDDLAEGGGSRAVAVGGRRGSVRRQGAAAPARGPTRL